jgi:5-methylcytosine-specific restriction endonuclease McrA
MCKDCSDQIKLEFPDGSGKGFKLTKEERNAIPGKEFSGGKAKATPEQWEAHKLFRRGYERLRRAWDMANGGTLKRYQKRYHDIYLQNHNEEQYAYYRSYIESNPEYRVRATTRRVERLGLVEREKYTIDDVVNRWGTICYLCNEEIDLEAPRHPNSDGWELGLQHDHVIPLHLGGPDTLENVKPTHGVCNLKKSHQVVTDISPEQLKKMEEFQKKYPPNKRGRPYKD